MFLLWSSVLHPCHIIRHSFQSLETSPCADLFGDGFPRYLGWHWLNPAACCSHCPTPAWNPSLMGHSGRYLSRCAKTSKTWSGLRSEPEVLVPPLAMLFFFFFFYTRSVCLLTNSKDTTLFVLSCLLIDHKWTCNGAWHVNIYSLLYCINGLIFWRGN